MSGTAQATVLAALNAVIRDHGWLVTGNPARLRATLSDVLGPHADEHRGLVDAVVVSAEEGVPTEIRAAGRPGLAGLAPTLVARLVDWGMAEDRAQWVVDAWVSLLPDSTMQPTPAAPVPPPVVQSPATPPAAATNLPPAEAAAPYLAPTILPPTPPTPGQSRAPGEQPAARRNRKALVIAGATVLALALGGTAAALVLTGDDKKESTAAPGDTEPDVNRATGSELFMTAARPDPFGPVGMAGLHDGVALMGLSQLPDVRDDDGTLYAPPEGGSLIGFKLGTWGCNYESDCHDWQNSRISVEVDGQPRRLPDPNTGDAAATYVVAVPADTNAVDLVLASDGRKQRISLLTGDPAPGNIEVLARRKRFWHKNRTFTTTESVNINIDYGDGIGRRSVTRSAEVPNYDLRFWENRRNTASSADRALLRVNTFYHYPQDEHPKESVWYWRSDEVVFVDSTGRRYRPVRPPKEKDSTWYSYEYYFDVPADVSSGVLKLGGSVDLTAGDGTPYIATTPVHDVPLRFS